MRSISAPPFVNMQSSWVIVEIKPEPLTLNWQNRLCQPLTECSQEAMVIKKPWGFLQTYLLITKMVIEDCQGRLIQRPQQPCRKKVLLQRMPI